MPILDPATRTRLLGSIEAGQLVILCGAGLSMPPPSNLMSAAAVSRACYDKWLPTEALPTALREDIDALAGHFHRRGQFKPIFISTLVPWNELVGEPNVGHAAVADLLICRAAHAALSANFDPLVEQWAERRKIAMQGALTGAEAVAFTQTANPLVKFHGCLHRGRSDTLWTHGQLTDPDIAERIENCSAWMVTNLPNKDLLLVGFWTDWGYLNSVLAEVIDVHGINSVTVVDPASSADLEIKAPALWQKLTTVQFEHVRASGAEMLDELRSEFTKVWLRKFLVLGVPAMQAESPTFNPATVVIPTGSSEELYDMRRDAEGAPYDRAAKRKEPQPETARSAFAHLLLMRAGARHQGAFYDYHGTTIRVIHGAGQELETVRERYNEPPATPSADVVICAGSNSLNVPPLLIASGHGANVVRPARGGSSRWLTLEQARMELTL